ncbi:efflux RND transporter periplasmic adaptor subunit [Bdellovibrionota bacterium FG-2]
MKHCARNVSFTAIAVFALCTFEACQGSFGSATPTGNIAVVKKDDLVQRVTVAGIVVPKRRTVISPPYNGYLKRVFVRVGDSVSANDPIVTIVQTLHGNAEDTFPMRSPFPGTVVQVLRTEGEYVEMGKDNSSLVRIDDLSQLFIETDVAEIEIPKLKVGQEVVIKASALLNRSFKGVIRQLSLAAKEKRDWGRANAEFPVRMEVLEKDPSLKPGMSTMIDIIAQKVTGVLILRHEYIQKVGEKYFAVLEDGTKQSIEVGLQNEEAFEIKSGLKEGDRVKQTDYLSLSPEPK